MVTFSGVLCFGIPTGLSILKLESYCKLSPIRIWTRMDPINFGLANQFGHNYKSIYSISSLDGAEKIQSEVLQTVEKYLPKLLDSNSN